MHLTADPTRAFGGRGLAALARHASLAAALVGFVSTPSFAAPTSAPHVSANVRMHDIAFLPQSLVVVAGTTITWTNDDDMAHTVTSGVDNDDAAWASSPEIPPGGTFSVILRKAGTYHYFCEPHRYSPAMHATIVVQPAAH